MNLGFFSLDSMFLRHPLGRCLYRMASETGVWEQNKTASCNVCMFFVFIVPQQVLQLMKQTKSIVFN